MRHRFLEVSSPVKQTLATTDSLLAIAAHICGVADENPGEPVQFTVTTTYENEAPPPAGLRPSSQTAPQSSPAENAAPGNPLELNQPA